MKRTLGFLIVIVIALLCIAGYLLFIHRDDRPPLEAQPLEIPDLPVSIIQVPVSVSEYDIERAIREQIKSPAISGISPEISVNLLASDSIPFAEMVKEVISPAKPAQIINTTKTEMRAVRESFGCAINPFKWGHCWRDVLKPVQVPTTIIVAQVDEVYKWVSKPVFKLIDKIYPVAAWLNYDIYLQDLSLKLSGNTITISVSTRTHLKFDYRPANMPLVPNVPLVPNMLLGRNIVIKGLLDCDIDNEFTLSGTVNVNDSLGLDVELNEDQTAFDFKRACAPFAVQGIDVFTTVNPAWFGFKKALQAIIKSAVNNAISKKIDDSEESLQFKERIASQANKINNPWMIASNLWLIPNVQEGSISNWDTYDKDNISYLRVNVGLIAKPTFIYSVDTPMVVHQPIVLKKSNTISPGVDARLTVGLDYMSTGKTLTDSLKTYVNHEAGKIPLTTGQVTLYPSGERLVIGVDIAERGGKKLGTVYLWGHPRFDTVKKSFVVDSLDYYLASKNVLIRIANDILAGKILTYLKGHSEWSVDSLLADTKRKLQTIAYPTEYGNISGSLTTLSISKVFTTTNQLQVFVDLKGILSFQLLPLQFIVSKPSPKTGSSKMTAGDFGVSAITTDIHHVGEPENVVVKDSVVRQIVTFKNKSLPGDTVFYSVPGGSINYYIIQRSDIEEKKVSIDFGTPQN